MRVTRQRQLHRTNQKLQVTQPCATSKRPESRCAGMSLDPRSLAKLFRLIVQFSN